MSACSSAVPLALKVRLLTVQESLAAVSVTSQITWPLPPGPWLSAFTVV